MASPPRTVVAALVAAALAGWLAVGLSGQSSLPRFDRVEHDFGPTKPGKPLETSFVVANHSETALQIEKIVPSCGCMTHDVSPAPIAPGESREISVQLDTSNFVAPADLSKTVAVTIGWQGRSDKETTLLRLNAQLRDALAPTRPVVTLAPVEDGERFLGEVQITRDGLTEDDFRTLRIRQTPANLHCQIVNKTGDAATLRCWTTDSDVLFRKAEIGLAYQWDGVACAVDVACCLEGPLDVEAKPSCLILTQKQKQAVPGDGADGGQQIRLASHGRDAVEIVDFAFDDHQAGDWFVCQRDAARPNVLNVRLADDAIESLVTTKLILSYRRGNAASEIRRLQVPVYVVAGKAPGADARAGGTPPARPLDQGPSVQ